MNDKPHVEQKNWTHARQLFGYDRIGREDLVPLMNELYRTLWCPLQNHFCPALKLKEKSREGSRYIRRYHVPMTAYERVMTHPDISDETKTTRREQHAQLNPFKLKAAIERRLKVIFSHITVSSIVRQRIGPSVTFLYQSTRKCDRLCFEIWPYPVKLTLNGFEIQNDLLLEVCTTPSRRAHAQLHLQAAVHRLIWIQSWGITLKKEHLDLLYMFLKPGLKHLDTTNPQAIQHQQYLPSCILNLGLSESDQELPGHVLSIIHEAYHYAIGDRRDQIDSLSLSVRQLQYRHISLRSMISGVRCDGRVRRLIPSINFGAMAIGEGSDRSVIRFQQLLNRFWSQLQSPLDGSQRMIPSAVQMPTNRPNMQINHNVLLELGLDHLCIPNGKTQSHLVWRLIQDIFSDSVYLLKRQGTLITNRASRASLPGATSRLFLSNTLCVGRSSGSKFKSYGILIMFLLARSHQVLAQLLTSRMVQSSAISSLKFYKHILPHHRQILRQNY